MLDAFVNKSLNVLNHQNLKEIEKEKEWVLAYLNNYLMIIHKLYINHHSHDTFIEGQCI